MFTQWCWFLIGWVFFFSPSLGYAFEYLGMMFGIGASGFIDGQAVFLLLTHWLLYLLAFIGCTALGMRIINRIIGAFVHVRVRMAAAVIVYIGMFFLSVAFLVTDTFNPFLYFRF